MKKILTISFLFLFAFIATGIITAQNSYTFKDYLERPDHSWAAWALSPKIGTTYNLCSTSNPNSEIRSIKIQVFKIDNLGWHGNLIFFDQNGNKLVTGPKKENSPTTLHFTHVGVSQVVSIADIDEDGYTEVMIQEMQSDVRPYVFTVLKWKNGKLYKIRTACLIKDSDGIFKWTKNRDHKSIWLNNIKETTDGRFYADFMGYNAQGFVNGLVEITPIEGGYKVVKTLKSNKK